MTALSLRARVAAAAAAAIVVAVGVLAIAVPALLQRQLTDELDRSLRARAVEVARLASATPALLTEPGALEGRLTGGALFVQVVDRRGRIVARSGGLGGRLLPAGPALRSALSSRRADAFADATLGPEPIRIYAAPLGELGGGAAAGGAVMVAGTTAGIDDTLDSARRLVLLCALAAAALAALTALLLTRRALRPLGRLSSGARTIERTGDASARLPVPPTRDEIGALATTLNAMLASLERAREAEQRFVADASHELRTPLTALRGNAAYVARHGAEPGVLADIEADAARLASLLDDLLALAREDAAAPAGGEDVDLAELARDVAATEERAEVVIETGAAAATVRGEPDALRRALANLVHNARMHGPAGGRITLTVGLDAGGERARITVADEGSGLTAEEAAHAFERFWRGADARSGGSGLGLAIVRAIAERHGGTIRADGPNFTIELPALRELSKSPRRTPPAMLSADEGTGP
jgi:two-component system OmpR family sensor kinase